MSKTIIIILNDASHPLASNIADVTGGSIEGLAGRVTRADKLFDHPGQRLVDGFCRGDRIVAIMAAGAVIRLLSPVLNDKRSEPPVIAVSADGSSVVPLLGGHYGANDLANKIADKISGFAAITTAGDTRFGVALDNPPNGYHLANPEDAKSVMAAILNGADVKLNGDCEWLQRSALPFSEEGEVRLTISEKSQIAKSGELLFHPKTLVLGVGCERHADPGELAELVEQTLGEHNYSPRSIALIASLDVKADEPAVLRLAEHFCVPARFFACEELERETPRLANPSKVVFAEVGCHGVAEGAALASVGSEGQLVIPKHKSARCTMALAQANFPFADALPGRKRGQLYVVGIGPGQDAWRSPEVTDMIERSDDLVGYSLYLDLVSPLIRSQTRHDFNLGKEEDRVRHAMELAGQGRNVSLVCSGDAGIYAMATLVFELLESGGLSDAARRIGIEVSPGISALQAAAARAGAPLGHDFCTISLSDLLTPWEAIQRRIKAAAEGDFVISFYNPVSKRRRTQLTYARDILLKHRSTNTPVVLATNLGRTGEQVRMVELQDLKVEDVDMLTVVIVGSSQSRAIVAGDGRQWMYTPRGYAEKQGTGIAKPAELKA